MTEIFKNLEDVLGDRYAVERELGRSGIATVYLVRDLKHDRSVAIKVLRPELAAGLGSDRVTLIQEIERGLRPLTRDNLAALAS
ncbi:MAG: hypothetical protein ABI765_17795 [Gemmatimonadota bacterium]